MRRDAVAPEIWHTLCQISDRFRNVLAALVEATAGLTISRLPQSASSGARDQEPVFTLARPARKSAPPERADDFLERERGRFKSGFSENGLAKPPSRAPFSLD
jgi:hypothetical protein